MKKIIVSLTSFPERINQVRKVLDSILNNTLKPDLIVLVLSIDEFPNKEIPKELTDLENEGKLKIKWVEGNEYPYKKLMYTLKDYPDDLIITVDDDVIYAPNIIQTLVNEYYENGERNPITGGHFIWKWCHRCSSHHGTFTITHSKFFGDYIFNLYEKYIKPRLKTEPRNVFFDDEFYTFCAALNGTLYKPTKQDLRPLKKLGQLYEKSKISEIGTRSYRERKSAYINWLIQIIYAEYNKNIIDEIGKLLANN